MRCLRVALLLVLLIVLMSVVNLEIHKRNTLKAYASGYARDSCEKGNLGSLMAYFSDLQRYNLDTINSTGKFFIYWAPGGTGLGNRMPPAVSVAILSLLTERGFLVYWPANKVTTNNEAEIMAMVPFANLFDPPFMIDYEFLPQVPITDENSVGFEIEDDLGEFLLCQDLDSLFPQKRFIILRGKRSFLDLISHNTFYRKRITDLGLTAKTMKHVGRCLFNPAKGVNQMIEEILNTFPAFLTDTTVGVHIRALSNRSVSAQRQKELWNHVSTLYPPSNYFYFLASDSNATLNNVPQEVLPHLIFQNGTEITRITKEGIQRALADLFLLGQTKNLFGDTRSTFVKAVQILFDTNVFRRKTGDNFIQLSELPCFNDFQANHLNLSCDFRALENAICL